MNLDPDIQRNELNREAMQAQDDRRNKIAKMHGRPVTMIDLIERIQKLEDENATLRERLSELESSTGRIGGTEE